VNYGETASTGDIIFVIVDRDIGTLEFHINGRPMSEPLKDGLFKMGQLYFATSIMKGNCHVSIVD
jgi:hypothetical protein